VIASLQETIKDENLRVLLVTPVPDGSKRVGEYAQATVDKAKELGIPVLDLYKKFTAYSPDAPPAINRGELPDGSLVSAARGLASSLVQEAEQAAGFFMKELEGDEGEKKAQKTEDQKKDLEHWRKLVAVNETTGSLALTKEGHGFVFELVLHLMHKQYPELIHKAHDIIPKDYEEPITLYQEGVDAMAPTMPLEMPDPFAIAVNLNKPLRPTFVVFGDSVAYLVCMLS
jgi:hypothetical protein